MKKQNKVAITFGRFQPPHFGHLGMFDHMRRNYAQAYIFLSRKQGDLDNPMTVEERMAAICKFRPIWNAPVGLSGIRSADDMFSAIERSYNFFGGENLVLVVGSDRASEGERIAKRFPGLSVDVFGARWSDAKPINTVSGSKMREWARSGDFDSFLEGIGSDYTKPEGVKLATMMYDAIRSVG
jgi:hypothetical protein